MVVILGLAAVASGVEDCHLREGAVRVIWVDGRANRLVRTEHWYSLAQHRAVGYDGNDMSWWQSRLVRNRIDDGAQ